MTDLGRGGGATLTANYTRNAEEILSSMSMQAKLGDHLKSGGDDHGNTARRVK